MVRLRAFLSRGFFIHKSRCRFCVRFIEKTFPRYNIRDAYQSINGVLQMQNDLQNLKEDGDCFITIFPHNLFKPKTSG